MRDAAALSGACKTSTDADPACYEDHLFKARTLRIIGQHDASRPLFLVHAFHAVHSPLQVPLAYLSRVAAAAAPFTFDDSNRQARTTH